MTSTQGDPKAERLTMRTWNEHDEVYGEVYGWTTNRATEVVYTIPIQAFWGADANTTAKRMVQEIGDAMILYARSKRDE